jgi:hypothetical protein
MAVVRVVVVVGVCAEAVATPIVAMSSPLLSFGKNTKTPLFSGRFRICLGRRTKR